MNPERYKCEMCGGVFDKKQNEEWSDDAAIAELRRNFGSIPIDDCALVCDDCYQKLGLK